VVAAGSEKLRKDMMAALHEAPPPPPFVISGHAASLTSY